ncbi:hypothetical protein [Desulfovibrio sp.]|uniref:hypothetical protein n=1 Tax=Desulfovibrio sp. TaxID=885 RepID=UPI0025C2CFA2|nr:hypothetical protein [Desulfovibrio sp.]
MYRRPPAARHEQFQFETLMNTEAAGHRYVHGAEVFFLLQENVSLSFYGQAFLERFTFEKGETRGGGTAPPGPK